jgi:magnesium transporter
VTVSIMVPTFVVSAFSMNVPVPLSAFEWSFWVIMGMAALSVLAWVVIWKRWRWL